MKMVSHSISQFPVCEEICPIFATFLPRFVFSLIHPNALITLSPLFVRLSPASIRRLIPLRFTKANLQTTCVTVCTNLRRFSQIFDCIKPIHCLFSNSWTKMAWLESKLSLILLPTRVFAISYPTALRTCSEKNFICFTEVSM